ncbi:VWA domain-containing protein, partial [bacterium]|nr:VWA domain-containing protein [bacterium]
MRWRMSFRWGATLFAVCVLTVVMATGASAAEHSGADYVLLIDCTGTMQHAGRGTATLEVLESFVASLNKGDRVTVYGYGEEPFSALASYPVMIDLPTTPETITEALHLPFTADRTDITRGLELAWEERATVFSRALSGGGAAPSGSAYVILLTDGKLIPIYDDFARYDEIYRGSRAQLRRLGKLFAEVGIPIYSVGLGKAEKVDGELLAQVSESSGGAYRHAASSNRLQGVFESLMEDVIAEPIAVVEVGGEEALMVARSVSASDAPSTREDTSRSKLLDRIVVSASAGETGNTSRVEAALSQSFGRLGPHVFHVVVDR